VTSEVTPAPGLLPLLARFAEASSRAEAAAQLATRLGVDRVLVYVRDPELGVLLPAPGLPQTVAAGPRWRAFLRSCAGAGTFHGEVESEGAKARVTAYVHESGRYALVLFGDEPDSRVLAETLETLPLIGGIARAEHEAVLSRAEAEVARATGRHANDLAVALDGARASMEKALEESARLNAELQEADRRKDEFLAMLGHELRNPMAAMAGALEVMRARPDDLENVARARAVIERQAEQLARLVDDLLDVARVTRGKIVLRPEVVDVAAIALRAIEATQAFADSKQHEIELAVRQPAYTRADCARLEQMLTNLLTNAAKYTDSGGHIRIVVDREGEDVTIAVSDDGIGIPADLMPRIFDAFLQVEPSIDRGAGGLGVGLTVVRRLAQLHGGSVDAVSELGKGSTFTLRLPAVAAPPLPTAAAVPAATGVAAGAKKRVLVVDDNVDSGEMLVALLENWGHEAFHAVDGVSAVAMAHELTPDIVLLDIGLPGMDGYEVAARLRLDPATQHARIVAVSGYGQDSDRIKSRAAGCDEHLVKPVDLAVLGRVIAA